MAFLRGLFYEFIKNIARCFKWRFLIWHLLAVVLTYFLVTSGFDWAYFVYFRGSFVYAYLFPAVILGGFLPIIAPLALYFWGKAKQNLKTINTAFAVGQAGLLGYLVSIFYKTFTGRVPPPYFLTLPLIDISRKFQFGILRGGVFDGWPSSHTTVAMACAAALFILYPKDRLVKFSAALLVLYIGLGVSISIHWFSDFVAGAIIGSTIGIVVGRSFLTRYKNNP